MSRIANLPAGLPLLSSLARGLLDEYADSLADCVVLLPSRRACLGLRDAFLDVTDRDALLLPRLQPVGEAGIGELPLSSDKGDIPAAIAPLRRQLLLARLIKAMRGSDGRGITDEHAIRLAAELASFLDELQTEEVVLDRLGTLVKNDHAGHWQKILDFLNILRDGWPNILAEEGCVDPAAYRRILLDQQIERWHHQPPDTPVIAAGITGTIPVVARLLAAVAQLPRGLVLLPGLDRGLDEASWQAVRETPTHPQFALARLLGNMDVKRDVVHDWRGLEGRRARQRLIGDIMRPPATSGGWQSGEPPGDEAFGGLERADLPDFATEAELICLRMRAALEEPGRRAALVTGDRNLGRRVAAEMRRFDVNVDDSAGTPLDQTAPGRFLLLSARAVIEGLPPVTLLALLKHPLARGGMPIVRFRSLARRLEYDFLRGPRPASGFAGLAGHVGAQSDEYGACSELLTWLAAIEEAAAPLTRLLSATEQSLPALIDAHLAFAEWLAADEDGNADALWDKEAGEGAAAFMHELTEACHCLDPVAVTAYPALLAVLMGGRAVYPQGDRHPRVAILGQLESRLLEADTVLIGGLNEGVWPRPPTPSPWLNRTMRKALGLPPMEQAIGIAAQDFAQAMSVGDVLLTRARKDAAAAPSTASRWLVRMDAMLKSRGLQKRIEMAPNWLQWAMRRGQARQLRTIGRPQPRPPLLVRPRDFSVTDIETLMRDPYSFYARRILRLRELGPLDAEPGGAEKGTMIHAILEDFVRQHPVRLPEDALHRLLRIGQQHFAKLAHSPQVRAIWWPRFCEIAEWFMATERARRAGIERVLVEGEGRAEFAADSGSLTLRARADRLEVAGGQVHIIDYKTGSIPNKKEVLSGRRPQLPLTALIAEAGGFAGIEGKRVAEELLYWSLKGGRQGAQSVDWFSGESIADIIEEARQGVARLIDHFSSVKAPYTAVPRPEIAGFDDAYDHLARAKEWQGSMSVRGKDGDLK